MYELIQRMESVFYKMILPDIEKAMNENVSIGTFILTACLIDYLAGFTYIIIIYIFYCKPDIFEGLRGVQDRTHP